jgi:phosphatidylethanolamine-binding protein (PEBP) family uncharacterized protein
MMSQHQVFDGFGMTGRNISPSLSWSGFPAQTKNFAVTLFDPDAPTGSGWWHWLVLGIPASVTKLKEGAVGAGGSGLPDPPHHYVFAVHALDVESLGVSDEISPAMAGFNLRFHNHRPCRAHPRVRLLIFNSARRSGQHRSRGGWPGGPSSHGDISARWRLSGEVCAGQLHDTRPSRNEEENPRCLPVLPPQ